MNVTAAQEDLLGMFYLLTGGAVYSPALTDFTMMVKVVFVFQEKTNTNYKWGSCCSRIFTGLWACFFLFSFPFFKRFLFVNFLDNLFFICLQDTSYLFITGPDVVKVSPVTFRDFTTQQLTCLSSRLLLFVQPMSPRLLKSCSVKPVENETLKLKYLVVRQDRSENIFLLSFWVIKELNSSVKHLHVRGCSLLASRDNLSGEASMMPLKQNQIRRNLLLCLQEVDFLAR